MNSTSFQLLYTNLKQKFWYKIEYNIEQIDFEFI